MDAPTLIRVTLRRLPLILALGVVCGLAAWLVERGHPPRFEQRLSFVLRPDDRLSFDEANHAADTIENRDSAITQTVVGLLDDAPSGAATVKRTVTLRPGSNIIDVDLQGSSAPAVARTARRYAATAPALVSGTYRIYQLQLLAQLQAPTRMPSTLWRDVVLAVLLGCALGVGVAALEHVARGRPRAVDDRASGTWLPVRPADRRGERTPEPIETPAPEHGPKPAADPANVATGRRGRLGGRRAEA